MQQLLDDCIDELRKHVSAGKLPHRIERKAIVANWNPVHNGVVQPQPPQILPSYCIVSPEPTALPSVDIDVAERDEHIVRVREAFKLWFEKAGTSDLLQGMKSLMREAVIDGHRCSVLPFSPEVGQSIPRKSIASKAFKAYGFKSIGKATSGSLLFVKTLIDGEFEAQVEFDFGTWRRTVIADYFLLWRGSTRIAKAHRLHSWYWSHDTELPILDKHLFQITMENAACSAGFVTKAVERALLGKENQSVEADR
ncbi:MAG: hypothetical protein NTY42_13690 [Planctomycetota bacterium]|jgi:hypothetical protein|nr:hypothetical protein [Planctomycetota bacterium]